ncbi:MAG: efflux RND transporter periplasmic adaptor subunit [Thermodesulfovibrionales bacterium]
MKKAHLIFLAAFVVAALSAYFLRAGVGDFAPDERQAAAAVQEAEAPAQAAEQAAVEEAVEAPEVEVPEGMQQLIGVRTTLATLRPMEKVIRTVGRVQYNERGLATVSTKVEGWIERLYIDYTGRPVRKGEPMAELYSPELVAAQEEHLVALRWAREGGSPSLSGDSAALLDASRKRLRLWDISEAQIEALEKTGKVRRTLTIYSPAGGVVIEKTALEGMKVMAGEKLFDVADLSTVWVLADVYEYELPLVRPDEKVKVRLSYLPGREFESRVDYIYPTMSGETRTAKVRIELKNAALELKPNMFADMEVSVPLGVRLAVPADAVIDTGTRRIIYVDKGEGYFEPREVLTGQRAGGFVEIVEGVSQGERVASAANFLIDSEAQFRGVKPLPLRKRDAQ